MPDSSRKADQRPDRPMGRLRAAWLVLFGQRVTPQQIEWEWAEYRQTFNDFLSRYGALLARQAKAEKARVEALQRDSDQLPLVQDPQSHKAELRSRVAAMRGLRSTLPPAASGSAALELMPSPIESVPPPPEPETDP